MLDKEKLKEHFQAFSSIMCDYINKTFNYI